MTSTTEQLDVAVAILQRSDGRVLLAQRPARTDLAGYWEFPGGKLEPGEDLLSCLARELREELGIDLITAHRWVSFTHHYAHRSVRLHFFRVLGWHGEPAGCEGQALSWQDPARVEVAPVLPANDRIWPMLALPSLYAISQAGKLGMAEFLQRLDAALQRGVRLIQVRERDLTPAELEQLIERVVARTHLYGGRVLVNGDRQQAEHCGADGVHLQAGQLMLLTTPPGGFWSASCHNRQELEQAAAMGASFVVLSPVLPTPSHPEAAGMGWQHFEELVSHMPIPVYALGGMTPELLDTAMQHGAHGISMLSGVW